MNDNSKTVVALLAGLAAGAALGILFAPEKGEETVDKLSRALRDLKGRVLDKAHEEIGQLAKVGNEISDKVKDKFASVKAGAKEELTDKIAEA